MLLVIPAVDILNGQCVRLYQGSYTNETVYFDDPIKMAKLLRVQNARALHVVDLDAARGGSENRANNRETIGSICRALDIPVQVGGGIRTMDDVEEMLQLGAHRVIVGTACVRNPEMLTEAVTQFSASRIVVGIDAKNGEVRIDGWTAGSGVEAADLALEMEARGCRRIIYTDISRDGTMQGPNIEAYRALGERLTSMKITASGGVSGYKDLLRLIELHPFGIDSVIIGKAFYENAFPCQQFWCWNEKNQVNLDRFSSAELKGSFTAAHP